MKRGKLQRTEHRGRDAAVVLHWFTGGDRIKQYRGLLDLAGRDQGWACVGYAGDFTSSVVLIHGAGRILNAALVHQARKRGGLLGTAAETHRGKGDVGAGVILQPVACLASKLVVPSLNPRLERAAGDAVDQGRNLVVLGARAGNVARSEVR